MSETALVAASFAKRSRHPRVIAVLVEIRTVVEPRESRPVAVAQGRVHPGVGQDEAHERLQMLACRLTHRLDVVGDGPEAGRDVVVPQDLEHPPGAGPERGTRI